MHAPEVHLRILKAVAARKEVLEKGRGDCQLGLRLACRRAIRVRMPPRAPLPRRKKTKDQSSVGDAGLSFKGRQKQFQKQQAVKCALVDAQGLWDKLKDPVLVQHVKVKDHASTSKNIWDCLAPGNVKVLTAGVDANSFFLSGAQHGEDTGFDLLSKLREAEVPECRKSANGSCKKIIYSDIQ